jgi:hypothetical protein
MMLGVAENNTGTKLKRVPGRPFVKGQSGNPGGRPKKDPELIAILKLNTENAVKRLVSLIDSDDERVALSAVNSLLDRVWGKPETSGKLELLSDKKGKQEQTIKIQFISPSKGLQELPDVDGSWFDCQ